MHTGWENSDVYRYRTVRTWADGQYCGIRKKNGAEGEDSMIIFASNDYFGLAQHPKVKAIAKHVIDEMGVSSTGSGPTTGLTSYHISLENQLAELFSREAALLFNSGFAVNTGCLPPLAKGNVVFCDRLCHSSIQDGLRMATTYGAKVHFFRHNDVAELKKLLLAHRASAESALIVTEDCFSMDGDFADLESITALKKQFNAKLYLDCAHGFGILNPKTKDGIYAYLPDVDYLMVTFSKVAGGIGGAFIGDKNVVKYLNFLARSHMFSVSPPQAICAAVSTALDIYEHDHERLERLRRNIVYFRDGMRSLGVFSIRSNHGSPIFPVVVGDEDRMGQMTRHLYELGILVTPIVYPAVPRDKCRFRFTVSSEHTIADMDKALSALEQTLRLTGNEITKCEPNC